MSYLRLLYSLLLNYRSYIPEKVPLLLFLVGLNFYPVPECICKDVSSICFSVIRVPFYESE